MVLPHQLTTKPPLGSWSMKNMAISDSTVPVHNPDVGQSVTKRRRAEEKSILTAIQRRAGDVVIFTPPRKVALANDELEHETDCKPRRVIDAH